MPTALGIVNGFFPDVTSVKDSKTVLKIEVTSQDDRTSRKGEHKDCALAVACKRKLNIDGVIISRKIAYLIKGKKAVRFEVPNSISREIVSFDRGGGFAPGTYQLSRPSKCKLISTGERSRTGPHKTKSGRKIKFRHVTSKIRAVLAGHEGD